MESSPSDTNGSGTADEGESDGRPEAQFSDYSRQQRGICKGFEVVVAASGDDEDLHIEAGEQ